MSEARHSRALAGQTRDEGTLVRQNRSRGSAALRFVAKRPDRSGWRSCSTVRRYRQRGGQQGRCHVKRGVVVDMRS